MYDIFERSLKKHRYNSLNHFIFVQVIYQRVTLTTLLQYIPKVFAMENKLDKRWCGMELMDEEGKTWSLLLRHKKDTGKGAQFYIGGWRSFHKAYDLKTGDHIGFELIHSGKRPLMKFRSNFKGFQEVRGKDCLEQRVSFKPCGFPHCSMVVKPYWKTKGVFFPSALARENGLINRRCEVETMDEKGRKRSLPLRGQRGNRAHIASFRTFYEANGLEPGDRVTFVLVNSAEDIVMKFYTTESNV
ncbi:hypothetical protein Cgig2_026386 [Carnegiea gigantea]|uniref:TF-B3 domain-containing protein n=1 Tax=Carnegiea gigantea TaxID=171969 RepID=A0A9Q1GKH9_9CARY|nr:hypothetical protein Cgig2_027207 [Carnegiea gigantea]KAJ8435294.1 hypothetical protein Cgig2_026386 [Carnegiea gigantea]